MITSLFMILAMLFAFWAGTELPSANKNGGRRKWVGIIFLVVRALLWAVLAYFAAKDPSLP